MNIDLYPDKAQFISGEPITLMIEIKDTEKAAETARLTVTRLEKTVSEHIVALHEGINRVVLEGFEAEFAGYGAVLRLISHEGLKNTALLVEPPVQENALLADTAIECYTAFDVVSDCTKAIRYGFLSDFHTDDGNNHEDVSNLRKFHINMIQYYDWAYRHDDLVAKESVYRDLMGKETDLETVKKKIAACHSYGIKAIGYGAIYAASRDFYDEHRDWGLYNSAGDPLVFIDTFYLMNVAKTSPWRQHIIREYAKAISEVGFDGIHMDTYGFPKTAFFSQNKQSIRLEEEYPSLIEETKKRLVEEAKKRPEEETKENYLIFNNVGNWPVGAVAAAPQAAVYIEVWNPYTRYEHIRQIIWDAKRECKGNKPIILAAYLEPFRTDTLEQAANAAYLLTAAITANGAYHLLLGEENGVLTQGYYVDYSAITPEVSEKLRGYYDFIVQYMELFYDPELIDVSMTHMGWDNTEYRCLHPNWSVTAEPDSIWLTIREKEYRKVITLINLCGNQESIWNRGKKQPELQNNILLQVQIDYSVKGLYYISPEDQHGKVQSLPYDVIKTDRGWVIEFIVPQLSYWSSVWIDFQDTAIPKTL